MKKERPIKLTFRITRQEVEQKLNQGKPLSDYHYRWIRKYIKSWNGINNLVWTQEVSLDWRLTEEDDDGWRIKTPKEIKEMIDMDY